MAAEWGGVYAVAATGWQDRKRLIHSHTGWLDRDSIAFVAVAEINGLGLAEQMIGVAVEKYQFCRADRHVDAFGQRLVRPAAKSFKVSIHDSMYHR